MPEERAANKTTIKILFRLQYDTVHRQTCYLKNSIGNMLGTQRAAVVYEPEQTFCSGVPILLQNTALTACTPQHKVPGSQPEYMIIVAVHTRWAAYATIVLQLTFGSLQLSF